jgi:hypothetical protein
MSPRSPLPSAVSLYRSRFINCAATAVHNKAQQGGLASFLKVSISPNTLAVVQPVSAFGQTGHSADIAE